MADLSRPGGKPTVFKPPLTVHGTSGRLRQRRNILGDRKGRPYMSLATCPPSLFLYICTMRKIYLIGAGNLATRLGIALQGSGNQLVGVYSKTLASAQQLGELLHCPYTNEISSVGSEADVYILSLKDDVLYADLSLNIPGNKIILHTSGSVEMEALSKYSYNYGVFYPLFTFTKEKEVNWKEIPICLESSNDHVKEVIEILAGELSPHAYYITSSQRASLHFAAVWVNNFTNHFFSIAEEVCKKENIPFAILEPIAMETVRKAFSMGAFSAQTGPAMRSDRKTLEKHLRLIGDDEILSTLYIYMSKAIREAHL